MKDNSSDQNYKAGSYDALADTWKSKLNSCYSMVYRVHVHKSNGGMFCTHYAATAQSNWNFSYMVQNTAKSLAASGYKYSQILENCFNNGVDDQGYSIGTVSFHYYK